MTVRWEISVLISMLSIWAASSEDKCETFNEFPNATHKGICVISGDPHIKTFDSLKFDFMGTCKYTLVKTCADDDYVNMLDVVGVFKRMRYHHRLSVITGLSIRAGHWIVQLDKNLNVYQVVPFPLQVQIFPYDADRLKINRYCNAVVMNAEAFGFTLYWSTNPNRVMIRVDNSTLLGLNANLCDGICGNYNGVRYDDLRSKDGDVEIHLDRLGHSFQQDLTIYQGHGPNGKSETCVFCQDCTKKSLCQSNHYNYEEAKQKCSIFEDHTPHSSVPSTYLNSLCVQILCASLPETKGLCYVVEKYIASYHENGAPLPEGWRQGLPHDCLY